MPIYEFRCNKCRDEFERLVFSSADSAICPKCSSDKVSKKISSFAMKTSAGFSSSSGGSGCSGCTSNNCGSCR